MNVLLVIALTIMIFSICSAFRALLYAKAGKAYIFTDLSGRAVTGAVEHETDSGAFAGVLIGRLAGSACGLIVGSLLLWSALS